MTCFHPWPGCNCPEPTPEEPPAPPAPAPTSKRKVSHLSTAQFASLNNACKPIKEMFGHCPYLVGSSTERADYRDVDVRSIIPDDEWDALFKDRDRFWALFCWAVSEMLSRMTGLPVDYQCQRMTEANAKFGDLGAHPRNPLGTSARLFAGGGDFR